MPDDVPLSAAVVFADIISRVGSESSPADLPPATTPAVRSSLSSFARQDDLPTEILLLIFKFVFEACVDWEKTGALSSEHPIVWQEEDPLSPSLFPYSIASVCTRWLHILNSAPAYWTRQVIAVDSRATPLAVVQTLLQWGGNLPLQLIIASHPSSRGETERDEHTRVRDLLPILRPYIRQTWSLSFDLKYSSSLPAVWREKGDAQRLRVLTLTSSRCDTGGAEDLPRLPELRVGRRCIKDTGPLDARLLQQVTFGGHFFSDTLALGKQRQHWFSNITSLTIRGYATSSRKQLSLYGFVSTLQTCTLLEKLIVEDVSFVNDVHISYRFRLEAPVVRIHKVTNDDASATLISQSLGVRWKEVVSVTECPFDNFGARNLFRTNLSSIDLVLDSMDASCTAIEKLVCFWNGVNLSLINCPGLSGSFMRSVPTIDTPPRLRRLRIVDCENVNTGCLMSFVKAREIQSEIHVFNPGDLDPEPRTALIELQVYGRGPPITHEQASWLSGHLGSFSWNTTARDGMLYTWDNTVRGLVISS